MKEKQISVFIENQPGRLVAMLEVLKAENIDICALAVSDTTDFGIVRMIVSDTPLAIKSLREANFTIKETTVLKQEIPDIPGGLLDTIARPLTEAGINIEYFYAFLDTSPNKATIIVKVSDPDQAENILRGS
jgi:hypothetical protein